MVKHVYILGAGFSVPLGGPFFNDLLTNKLRYLTDVLNIPTDILDAIKTLFPDIDPVSSMEGTRRIERMVHRSLNAEALLELVDTCSWLECQDATCLLQSMNKRNLNLEQRKSFFDSLTKHLRRVIAIQCDNFTKRILKEPDSERWKPYRRWFESLSGDDVIITFNYDTAIEKLATLSGRPFPGPGQSQHGRPTLRKLHGSADWVRSQGKVIQSDDAYESDLLEPCIGMPGQGKAELTELLFEQWGTASHDIRDASVVSIVGYSMPETDNYARLMILDALESGRGAKKQVNIVLGPDSGTIRARRMQAIIEPHVKCDVIDRPMFAQDFLPHVDSFLPKDPPHHGAFKD